MLTIIHDKLSQEVIPKDGVEWTLARQGEAGKLKFSIPQETDAKLGMGDIVIFKWNEYNVFYGVLFTCSITNDGNWDCVAYDQIRYLKNADTIKFDNASEKTFFKLISDVFAVKCEDALVKDNLLPTSGPTKTFFTRVEENKSGLDMVGDYADLILENEQRMFVLFDNFGELTFRDIEAEMGVGYLINMDNVSDYTYKISIDDRTYNNIRIMSDDKCVSAMDADSMFTWGSLKQNFTFPSEVISEETAKKVLDQYNRPGKHLQLKGIVGNVNVRAGCYVPVILNLPNEVVKSYMIVEKVTHSFKADEYTMDLTLVGGKGFVA